MTLPGVSPFAKAEIRSRLREIESNYGVSVLYACESGSRAWGMDSKLSDYDVRFVYAHPTDWYLTLRDRRDVIEQPIDDLLDISGWEIKKALTLFRKSNPPLIEWLQSPHRYVDHGGLSGKLRALATHFISPSACIYHYYHMAKNNYREYLRHEDTVKLKKYLYVVRPVMAIRWIEQGRGLPCPIEFSKLMVTLDGLDVKADVEELLLRKRRGAEMGEGPRIPRLNDHLDVWLKEVEAQTKNKVWMAKNAAPKVPYEDLDAIFHDAIGFAENAQCISTSLGQI